VDISRHATAACVPGADERREDHTEGKTMSPKTRKTANQKAEEEARGQALATWAETEMDIDPQGPRSRFAAPEDEAGRTMLEEALGGPAALARALGGRPTLDPAGARSRERKVRLSPPLDQRIKAAIDGGVGKDFSALTRAALVEYLDRHEHHASA
jgi:hypothetical protein